MYMYSWVSVLYYDASATKGAAINQFVVPYTEPTLSNKNTALLTE
jgi:hypothetical protein